MVSVVAVLLGLVVSFLYDVATGGVIVLISNGLFLLCVVLKGAVGSEAAAPTECRGLRAQNRA